MVLFTSFVFVAVITAAVAQNATPPDTSLRVGNSGGNATSPLQYGLMFEVREIGAIDQFSTNLVRTSIILEMVGYMPNLSVTVHFKEAMSLLQT
jgi:hypothetical protein